MFQKIPLFSSPLIDIRFLANTLKGGDYMERREILQAVNPAQAIDTGDIVNSRFPERVGRIKPELTDVGSDPITRAMEEMDMAGKMGMK